MSDKIERVKKAIRFIESVTKKKVLLESKTLNQYRAEIKRLGFNYKLKSLSFGTYLTFTKGKEEMPSIFSEESLKEWKPLIDFINSNLNELRKLVKEEGYISRLKNWDISYL